MVMGGHTSGSATGMLRETPACLLVGYHSSSQTGIVFVMDATADVASPPSTYQFLFLAKPINSC